MCSKNMLLIASFSRERERLETREREREKKYKQIQYALSKYVCIYVCTSMFKKKIVYGEKERILLKIFKKKKNKKIL